MPDFKDTGTTLYTTALGLTVYSALAFGRPASIAAAIIGTLYSSPGDIQDASNAWRSAVPKLEGFRAKLDALEKDVPEEDWKEMSRPEFQKAKQAFLARTDDSKEVYTGVADVLGGLSSLSQAAAVFSLVGASGLATWANLKYMTAWNVGLSMGLHAAGNMYALAFKAGLQALAAKHRKAMLVSAGVAVGAASLLASHKAEELQRQVAPERAPDFTQTSIEGLPQTGLPPGTNGLPPNATTGTTGTSGLPQPGADGPQTSGS
jgi:hypothetical protein